MSIQLFLRHPKPKRFTLEKEPATVKTLLTHWKWLVDRIPEDKRYQVSYTLHNCTENDRDFSFSTIYAVDIDDIGDDDLAKNKESYINIVANTFEIPPYDVGVVDSGYGMHFIFNHAKFTTDKWFKKNKHHNEYYCATIDAALARAGLTGSCDTGIFHRAAMLRLPGTMNRHDKKVRPERMASLIQPMGVKQINITESPAVEAKHNVDNEKIKATKHKNVPDEIMSRCAFMQSFRDDPEIHKEPTWQAMITIAGRMGDTPEEGLEWAQKLSAYHSSSEGPTWKNRDTSEKLNYHLEQPNSGPRTCAWIKASDCGKVCMGCMEQVKTPLMILPVSTIATEHTGFHDITGRTPKPAYDDLRQYFERVQHYHGVSETGAVHIYNGTHYEQKLPLELDSYAQDHFRPTANNQMVAEFRKLVARTNLQPQRWWAKLPPAHTNFKNGTLNRDTLELLSHDHKNSFRYCLPYDYDQRAIAPKFKALLNRVTGGDRDTQTLLLEFMGYSLSGDPCWLQKCLLLTGDGANGKSTLLELWAKLAGAGNYSSINMDDLNRSEYARQMLDGKLFNISEETPTKALLNSSLFKNLVSGGEITARAIYKDPYSIINLAKFIFTCNELPATSDNTYGFWRRMVPVAFNQTFTKETAGYDPHIGAKLVGELPGIFNLVTDAYREVKKRGGLTEPTEVGDTLKAYQAENDTVSTWVGEHMIIHKNGGPETLEKYFSPTMEMYTSYRETVIAQGRKPVSMVKFSKTLRKMPVEFWGDHPIAERESRRIAQVGDAKSRMSGIRGVQIRTFH